MTFTSIKIENFRSIQSFTCDRLARVTLIVGRNNCGKTSLLEALLLLANRRTTEILPLLNVMRQLDTRRVRDLDTLFYDPAEPLAIQATDSSGKARVITVARVADTSGTFVAPDKRSISAPESRYHLEQTFHDTCVSTEDATGLLHFTEEARQTDWDLRYETTGKTDKVLAEPPCIIIPARGGDVSARFVKALFMDRNEHILVDVLRGLDPRIQSVQLINDRLMVGLQGYAQLYPFQIMGDGVFRLLTILPALWVCRGGCVCIDEIDNGLHSSVQPLVWETLIRYAQEWDVQIIATSHHLDLLQAINTVYKNNPEAIPPQDFAYIVLSREGDAIHPYAFDLTDLTSAIELGLEVR